jgi:hypothetical protein
MASGAIAVRPGSAGQITVTITNTGDTRWLASEGDGWTRVGVHLFRRKRDDDQRELVDFDWLRAALPNDVAPKQSVTVPLSLPPLSADPEGRRYQVVIDLVIEGTAWFEAKGSAPLVADLSVQP